MSDTEKKTSLVIATGIAAAAAGIAVVAMLIKYRSGVSDSGTALTTADPRHIQQVLEDCYTKINEIESRLPQVADTISNHLHAGNGVSAKS